MGENFLYKKYFRAKPKGNTNTSETIKMEWKMKMKWNKTTETNHRIIAPADIHLHY